MLAVRIIFLSSILFVFVATLYLEGHTFSTIITQSLMATPILPFSRGECSLEVDLGHGYCSSGGSSLPPVYKQFWCFLK